MRRFDTQMPGKVRERVKGDFAVDTRPEGVGDVALAAAPPYAGHMAVSEDMPEMLSLFLLKDRVSGLVSHRARQKGKLSLKKGSDLPRIQLNLGSTQPADPSALHQHP